MNDTELDRLLNTWEAPAPTRSLREGLSARFPRSRRGFARPLKWALVALCSLGLTVAIAQTGESHLGRLAFGWLAAFHQGIRFFVDSHRAVLLVAAIRHSQPQVFVDGQPTGPLDFSRAPTFPSALQIEIPGDGVYRVMLFGQEAGSVEAGHMHGNVIEFEAGGKQVRIECTSSIIDGDMPVFVRQTGEPK